MSRKWLTPAVVVCMGFLVGCAATVVHKNPGPHDRGVRFYRPKPYLLVQPFGESKTTTDGDKKTVAVSNLSDRLVTMKLEWLPDFSEEYSIYAKTGIGKNKTSFKLENGWNLTELNVDIDSRVPENIEAVAKLIEAVPKAVGGFSSGGGGAGADAPVVVAASNVPLGYYESVLSRGPDGKKRLYGWRYVGFIPYATCPVEGAGVECVPCDSGQIYGLGFENGVMTFRPLPAMATDGKRLETQLSVTGLSERNVKAVVTRVMNNNNIPLNRYTVAVQLEPTATVTVTVTTAMAPPGTLRDDLQRELRGEFGGRAFISNPSVVVTHTPGGAGP